MICPKLRPMLRPKLRPGTQSTFVALAAVATTFLAAPMLAPADDAIGGFSWDSTDRVAVVANYARHFLPSEDFREHDGWNGDVDTCSAGTLSSEFLDDTMRRINWYRAQAGVPADVERSAPLDAKCQAAALVMANQGALSHTPSTSFPDNPCLSAAADQGAASSNLALGNYGPAAIDDLMIDDGSNNGAVGHRRWTLYPPTTAMGNGAIPGSDTNFAAHAQYVIGPKGTTPPARAVAWPNEGFVPWMQVPSDRFTPARWSFTYPGAKLTSATVTVERLGAGGGFLAVTKETVVAGYGDNTLAWRVSGVPDTTPGEDVTYRVTVDGVTNAPQATWTYDVTRIDPYNLGAEIVLDGPAQPPLAKASSYEISGLDGGADAYVVRVTRPLDESWTEGAEDAPAPRVIDGTTGTYALRETSAHATGAKAFHLTATDFDHATQSFTIDRILWPSASATLHFKNLRRCATTVSKLEAQVSRNGHAWTTIWSRAGGVALSCSSSNWDASFQAVDVPIPPAFQDATISVRFLFTIGAQAFIGTSVNYGFYIDDVSVSDATELGDAEESVLPGDATSFQFTPIDNIMRWIQGGAVFGDVTYEFGPPTVVTPGSLCGDATGDGKLTATDALQTLKAAVGTGNCPLVTCDVNDSGKITATDALSVLKKSVGIPIALDCPAS